MIIDHDHRYIFISVPKTGSISLQFALGYGHDIPEPDLYHQSIKSVLTNHPECGDYFKFAFVRNPWDRILSLYFDFTKKRGCQYSAQVRHDQPLLSEFSDFEDMCLNVKHTKWCDDVFFRSQTKQLSINDKIAIDFVGRFEHLATDFEKICNKIGISLPGLEQMNMGVYEKVSYRNYFSDASRKSIAEMYADDVENFNYEF